MKKNLKFLVAIVLLLSSMFVACEKEDLEIDPENNLNTNNNQEIVVNDNIIVIEDQQILNDKSEFLSGIYTYANSKTTSDFAINKIIVGQEGEGYLRRITNISENENNISLQTVPATLENVFDYADIKLQLNPSQNSSNKNIIYKGTDINYLAKGITSDKSTGITYNFSNTTIYQSDLFSFKITNGTATFNPNFNIDISIANNKLSRLYFATDNTSLVVDCDVRLDAAGAFNLYNSEKTLADYNQNYIAQVGGIPVIIVINTKLKAKLTADIDAEFSLETGFTNTYDLTLGAVYENGYWRGIYDLSSDLSYHSVDMSGMVHVGQKLIITPEVSVKLYGVAGPYCIPEIYEKFDSWGYYSWPWTWSWNAQLKAGMDARIGADITIFGETLVDYYKVYSYSKVLWTY